MGPVLSVHATGGSGSSFHSSHGSKHSKHHRKNKPRHCGERPACDSPFFGPETYLRAGRTALLLVGNTSLSAGDRAFADRLTGLGFQPLPVREKLLTLDQAKKAALVVISQSVDSTAITVPLHSAAVPLLNMEPAYFDDLKMSVGARADVDQGVQEDQTRVTVKQPGHPLSAGFCDTVTVARCASGLGWAVPGGDAIRAAAIKGSTTRFAVFGYDKNGRLADGKTKAPARRVGLFPAREDLPGRMTAEGWKFFDAAAAWAAPDSGAGAPDVYESSVSRPAGTSGPYKLLLQNGSEKGENRVTSAWITLNGAEIFGPSDFNPHVPYIEAEVDLDAQNLLKVKVAGKPGTYLKISLCGGGVGPRDDTPPLLTWLTPAPGSWTRDTNPLLSLQYQDPPSSGGAPASGVNPSSLRVTVDGTDQTSLFTVGASSASGRAPLPDGLHTVRATLSDVEGNSGSGEWAFRVDATSPTVRLSVPAPGALINTRTPRVTLAYVDGQEVVPASLRVFVNGVERTGLFTPGPTEASADFSAAPLPEGPVLWTGSITDAAGNRGDLDASIVVDVTAPLLEIDSPANASRFSTDQAEAAVRFSDAHGVDLSSFQAFLDGAPVSLRVEADRAGGTLSGLSEGPHVFSVRLRDRAGNQAAAETRFDVDTRAPDLTFLEPAAGVLLSASTATVILSYADEQGVDLSSFRISLNGADRTSLFTVGAASASARSVLLAEGENSFTAEIADAAGHRAVAGLSVTVDTVAPRVAAAALPPPNAAGWNNTAVDVSFSCADDGSGVRTCPPARAVSTDAVNLEVSGEAVDRAGNTASASLLLNVDRTPPVLASTSLPPANAAGWRNGPVTITFACDDALSGVEACPPFRTLAADGAAQPVLATVQDRAGNVVSSSETVNIDATPPLIVAAVLPAPNADGWNAGEAVVRFDCDDALSGVTECPTPVTLSEEGAGRRVAALAADAAGNTSPVEVTVNLDRTPPVLSVLSPSLDAVLSSSSTLVTGTVSDILSGVAAVSCNGFPADVSGIDFSCVVPLVEGRNVLSVRAVDRAGLETLLSFPVVSDLLPPSITASPAPLPNAAGWNNADVTVSFLCADAGSGVESCPVPVLVGEEASAFTVTGQALDRAGNRASASAVVNLDKTPPTLSIDSPAEGAVVSSPAVLLRGGASDALSGLEAVIVQPGGLRATVTGNTFEVSVPLTSGPNDLRVDAFDRAGNVRTVLRRVTRDIEGPSIVAHAAPPPNVRGWNNADVLVSFECADGGGGSVDCPAAQTVSTEGAGQVVSGTARDGAGNTSSASVSVSLDKTPPAFSATTAPLPGPTGWWNADVTVSYLCADALSGVLSCPPPDVVSEEGTSLPLARAARDAADNEMTVLTTLRLDKTPPQVSAAGSPPPNPDGWNNTPVRVTYACADALSGVASCPAPQDVSGEGAGRPVTGTAFDLAGNSAAAGLLLNIDTRPPLVATALTPSPNVRGWNTGDVTVSFSCTDGGAGVAACPPAQTVTGETAETFVSGTALDRAGNSVPVQALVRIDRTPPVLTSTISPPANAAGWHNTAVDVTYECADNLSGVRDCPGPARTEAEGVAVSIYSQALDVAGWSTPDEVLLKIDRTAPQVFISSPAAGAVLRTPSVTILGRADDSLSGVAAVLCNGGPATPTSALGDFSCARPLVPGENTFLVRALDAAGNPGDAAPFTVTYLPNLPPVAEAGGPYAGDPSAAIFFNGASSTDPDGDPLSYAWDFGDGAAGTGVGTSRLYVSSGSYTATLTVSDGRGGSASDTASVLIRPLNRRPTADPRGPYEATAGDPVSFSGDSSSDPDGDALSYAWSFGDGTSGAGASPTHVYASSGTYPVTLTVSDGRGGSHAAGTQAQIRRRNADPTARPGGPYAGLTGALISFDGSLSSDPDGDSLTHTWRFGDGASATGARPSRIYRSSGTYAVTLTVADGRGGVHVASTLAVIETPPNRPPVVSAGGPYAVESGQPLLFAGASCSDADGDALAYSWAFGDGGTSSLLRPSHIYVSTGAFSPTLTCSDTAGFSVPASASVTVSPPPDRVPPVVSLDGPRELLPGTSVQITAQAADNVGVETLRFTLDGSPLGTPFAAPPYEAVVQAPAVASPGDVLRVRAVARDAAGNEGAAEHLLTIASRPDDQPPVVSLRHPAEVAPGANLPLAADASDNVGVSKVVFRVDGNFLSQDASRPFDAVYAVPADAVLGSSLTLTAEAWDAAGNRAEALGESLVAAPRDDAPPTVTLTAPTEARPGDALDFFALAADDLGVADVFFRVEGSTIALDRQPPYEAAYVLSPGSQPGTRLRVEAVARDFGGRTAVDAADVLVTAPPTGQGLLAGEVYDDTTGLPVTGALVSLSLTTGENVLLSTSALTDAEGRYALPVPAGDGRLLISKSGWTTVHRPVSVRDALVTEPVDARLTPGTTVTRVTGIFGGSVASGPLQLDIPSGALSGTADVVLTRVGPQGLRGVLPPGWSPVAAVDVRPHAMTFNEPARLTGLSVPPALAGRPLVLSSWDDVTAGWRVLSTTTTSLPFAADLPGGGQFAWLLPDVLPAAPPFPAPGDPLAAAPAPVLSEIASARVNPDPQFIFYKPGVHSDVGADVSASTPVASGTRLWVRPRETYRFLGGDTLYPDPRVQDIFFHQVDAVRPSTSPLSAFFPITPFRTFSDFSLDEGVITVDVRVPEDGGTALIGPAGGEVSGPEGMILSIPPDATQESLAVTLAGLLPSDLGFTLPAGVSYIGGARVSLGGHRLTLPGTLSLPWPESLPAGAQVLLVQLKEVGGKTRLIFAARAERQGDRLVTRNVLPINGTHLEGVRSDGRYLLLRPDVSVAFAAGAVLAESGAGLSGTLVFSTGWAVESVSGALGRYAAALPVSAVRVEALDPATSDDGAADLSFSGPEDEAAVDVRLLARPPQVVSVVPADGARNVPLAGPVTVAFSEAIDPASVSGARAANAVLLSSGSVVPAVLSLTDGGRLLSLRPATALSPNAFYDVVLSTGVQDLSGLGLSSTFSIRFETLDTLPPPPPPAADLSAGIPASDGLSRVTGTQGSASPQDQVYVENVTQGFLFPALIDPNGSFDVRVPARLKDTLRLRIEDDAGNVTFVPLGRFRDPDGRVAIGPEGGELEAANGAKINIKPGTFPEGAVVKITPLTEAEVGVPTTPEFPFLSGFLLEASADPLIYIDASAPAPPGAAEGAPGLVAEVVRLGGRDMLNLVDTAKVVDGRLKTASPPCPGLLNKFAKYAMFMNDEEKMKEFGIALLSMTAARQRHITIQEQYLNIYVPWLPILSMIPITPAIHWDEPYYPASPFINHIRRENTLDSVVQALAAADEQLCFIAPADLTVRVVVHDANTGAVVSSMPVNTSGPGEVVQIATDFLQPGDTSPPEVALAPWNPDPPHILDAGQPLVLVFSEPVNVSPDGAFLIPAGANVMDPATPVIKGTSTVVAEGRTVLFVPDISLPMGKTFELRLPGLADLAGNVFQDPAAGPLTFRTYKTQVIVPRDGFRFDRQTMVSDLNTAGAYHDFKSVGFKDVDFVTRSPEESPDGKWHTTLYSILSGLDWATKFMTTDLSDPRNPKALATITQGKRYFQRLKVIPDISLQLRQPTDGSGDAPIITRWQQRQYRYAVDEPSIRRCFDPGDPYMDVWVTTQTAQGHTIDSKTGCGHFGISSSFGTEYSSFWFYDAFDPLTPVRVGTRITSDNAGYLGWRPLPLTPDGHGFLKGFDVIQDMNMSHHDTAIETHEHTLGVFGALNGMGLVTADAARNSFEIMDWERKIRGGTVGETLGLYSYPHFVDINVVRGKVAALSRGPGLDQIEVFEPGIVDTLGILPLPFSPERMTTATGLIFTDEDGDGTRETPHDITFVVGVNREVAMAEILPSGQVGLMGTISFPAVTHLRHVEIDRDAMIAYLGGTWTEDGQSVAGLLAVDIQRFTQPATDADSDGWDDRVVARIPLANGGTWAGDGSLYAFKIDPRRKLIYAGIEAGAVMDDAQTGLAVLKTCDCADLTARINLKESIVTAPGFTHSFPSDNGSTAEIFVEARDAPQQVEARFDFQLVGGEIPVSYTITEDPFSHDPNDRLLDLGLGASGPFHTTSPNITFYVKASTATSPAGSYVYIDFRDAQGLVLKRAALIFVSLARALQVEAAAVKIKTYVDKANGTMDSYGGDYYFQLSYDAKVTVRVDGTIINATPAGSPSPIAFDRLDLPAGVHHVILTREMAPLPGDHTVTVTAEFKEDVVKTQDTLLEHEVIIDDSLPVGHTFVKGVDLYDGHLSLQRSDLSIPGVGPSLDFTRSYSSSGNDSSGVMGAGWGHNHAGQVMVMSPGQPNEKVLVIGGAGSGSRYFNPTPGSDGEGSYRSYRPQAGYHGTLLYRPTGDAFDYYALDRTRFHYTPVPADSSPDPRNYRLDYIADSRGNRLTYVYGDVTFPEQPTEVRDAGGRALTFTYEEKGRDKEKRLTRVEGPMGLLITYDYDEYANLISVHRGAVGETYAYDTTDPQDRHNLTVVTGPNNGAMGAAHDVTRYIYYAAGDSFPGALSDPQVGPGLIGVPRKTELVKSVTEGDGSSDAAVTEFSYNYSNLATAVTTEVTDARDVVTRYTMHPRGAVTETRVLAAGGDVVTSTHWSFQDGINDVYITEKTDAMGRVYTFDYDARGNVRKQTINLAQPAAYAAAKDGGGGTVSQLVTDYEYDPVYNKLTLKRDSEGNETVIAIDPANGNLLSERKSPGGGAPDVVVAYTYADAGAFKGLMATMRSPNGFVTTFSNFDANGNPRTITDPAKTATQVFDARSRLVETSDTRGHRSLYANFHPDLDKPRRVTRFAVRQPADATMSSPDQIIETQYFPGGQVRETLDGLGRRRVFTYDALGRAVSMTDHDVEDADGADHSIASTTAYDGVGNKTGEVDGRGVESAYTYDDMGNLTRVQVSDGGSLREVSRMTYDAAGNLLTRTDQHGHLVRTEYNRLFQKVREVLPLSPYDVRTDYDTLGHPLKTTDPNGRETVMTYDAAYRLTAKLRKVDGVDQGIRYAYDPAGNITRETTVPGGMTTDYENYDALNRPARRVQRFPNPLGGSYTYTTQYAYDDAANAVTSTGPRPGVSSVDRFNGFDLLIERVIDPTGLNLASSYRYDANGNQTASKDPEGRVARLVFNGLNQSVRSIDPLGQTARTYYDGAGNVVRRVDRRGVATAFEFDAFQRPTRTLLTESISRGGAVLVAQRTVYDDGASRVTRYDAGNNPTVSLYDPLRRETRETNALSGAVVTAYDGVNVTSRSDRRGNVQTFLYDDLDRLLRVTDPAPFSSQHEVTVYNDALHRVTVTDRGGIVTLAEADALGRVHRVTRAGVALSTTEFDEVGRPVLATDAEGRRTRHVYDRAGRLVSRTDGDGSPEAAVTTFTYDRAGNRLTERNPRAVSLGLPFSRRFTYDALGRLLTEENALGHLVRYGYDPEGNRTSVQEPLGAGGSTHQTTVTHDEAGKPLTVTQPGGLVTSYVYDARRNLARVTDAEGRVTAMTYDALGRLKTTVRDPGGLALSSSQDYDADGRVSELVDPAGHRVTLTYDALGRKVSQSAVLAPSAPTPWRHAPQASFVYDARGNMTRVEEQVTTGTDPPGLRVTAFDYDDLDRLTEETATPPGGAARTVSFTYFNNGLRRTRRDNENAVTTYAYDGRNRLSTVSGPGGNTGYAYWSDGLLRRVTSANGVEASYDFDAAGRLTTLTNAFGPAVLGRYAYTHDANGNRLTQTEENGGPAELTSYSYDGLNRLSTVTYPTDAVFTGGRAVAYGYDRVGNRLSEVVTRPGDGTLLASKTGVFDAADRLMTLTDTVNPAATVVFAYDANGNMTGRTQGGTSQTYVYDPHDSLTEVRAGPVSTARFAYDFRGRRTEKIADGIELQSLYDGDSLWAEYAGAVRVARYEYGFDRLLSADLAGEGRRFYGFDGLGSVVQLTGDDGASAARYHLDAWGNHRFPGEVAAGGANPFSFTGHRWDRETALLYAQTRYYDPETARFTTQDSHPPDLSNPPSLHRYQYAYNNPGAYVDPDGQSPMLVMGLLGGAAGAVGGFGMGIGAAMDQAMAAPPTLDLVSASGDNVVMRIRPPLSPGDIMNAGLRGAAVGGAAGFVAGVSGGAVMGVAGTGLAGLTLAGGASGAMNGLISGAGAGWVATGRFDSAQALEGASRGALIGGVGGLVTGFAGAALNPVMGSSLVGSVLNNTVTGVAGDYAGQRLGVSLGWQKEVNNLQLASGALFGFAMGVATHGIPMGQGRGTVREGEGGSPAVNAAGEPPMVRRSPPSTENGAFLGFGCFTAGTMISTEGGFRRIEDVRVGDQVWAQQPETGGPALAVVSSTYTREVSGLWLVTASDITMETTAEHPFWVVGRGWTPAEELSVGDRLLTIDGDERPVQALEERLGQFTVHNFTVEGLQSYFVTHARILVHNNNGCSVGGQLAGLADAPVSPAAPRQLGPGPKPIGLLGPGEPQRIFYAAEQGPAVIGRPGEAPPVVEIEFPAPGLNRPGRQEAKQAFIEHLAEQQLELNQMPRADIEINLGGYRYLQESGILDNSRSLAESFLGPRPHTAAGEPYHAAHNLDAIFAGYVYKFSGYRHPVQSRIGSLSRTRRSQIQPGKLHILKPTF